MTPSPTREESLIDALGFNELEATEQEALMLDLSQLIFKGSLLRMFETLDEATKGELESLLATNPSDEEMEAFLAEKVPGSEQAIAETVEELTSDILAITGSGQY